MAGPLEFYDNILNELQKDAKNFRGDNLKYFSKNWYKNTKGKYSLDVITNGLKLDLKQLPAQNSRYTYPLSNKENEIISVEIKKSYLKNQLLFIVHQMKGEFISGIFTRDEKDGNKRMILNFKKFHKFVNYKHFKMESVNNVIKLIKPNVCMASIDLKDTFFLVPIHKNSTKVILREKLVYLRNQYLRYTGG